MTDDTDEPTYEELIRRADTNYSPIAKFSDYKRYRVDEEQWNAHVKVLKELAESSAENLKRALEVVRRHAAIETGAIEGLYDIDRGKTITIAAQGAMWEAVFNAEPQHARELIECQLKAYDYILDFATGKQQIAEAWIRELHVMLCNAQKTVKVKTPLGDQDQALEHGAYKKQPNHVQLARGEIHSYAPVNMTNSEMNRFCDELRSEEFVNSHPVIQAAYAHHAFTAIHPFQDGNGRVARALASIYLYKGNGIPFLVFQGNRSSYFSCLERADGGEQNEFIDFVFQRGLDTIMLVSSSFRTANSPDPKERIERISKLYETRGGYTHQEIDLAGQKLLRRLEARLAEQIKLSFQSDRLQYMLNKINGGGQPQIEGYRPITSVQQEFIRLVCETIAPASARVTYVFHAYVPRDTGVNDPIKLRCEQNGEELEVPVSRILNSPTEMMDTLIDMYVQAQFGKVFAELETAATVTLRQKGY